ncbi:MAG: DJ-1/PfpI family protein [Epsilonproteobacteria bacterium]|nr:DJ-1/PfpI family protein [Campylobacterota bacterium]
MAENKKILFVLMPKGYQEVEFNEPYQALTNKGYQVDVAGLEDGNATGHRGNTFKPDFLLSELNDEELSSYDAMVIPGGPGSQDYLWDNRELQETVMRFHSKGNKLLATICNACAVPAQAGLLRNKKATIFPAPPSIALLEQEGVTFVDQGCMTLEDIGIITAQSPTEAKAFADAIIQFLTLGQTQA